jgi:hypothetical protein
MARRRRSAAARDRSAQQVLPRYGQSPRRRRSSEFLKWFKCRRAGAQQNRPHLVSHPGRPATQREGEAMISPAKDDPNEPAPWMQQLLDNPFILLFLGVLVPMVLYTLWGVIDILTLPLAK